MSLSRDELQELDEFLSSDAVPAGLWGVDVLHGFLTSVALSASEINREQWLPLVWNTTAGPSAQFRDSGQEKLFNTYVLRMYDDIRATLDNPDAVFHPLVALGKDYVSGGPLADGTMWCNGFMLGLMLLEARWSAFLTMPARGCLLLPIFLLGSDSAPPEWEGMCDAPQQRARLTEWIPAVVEAIHVQRFVLELIAEKESRETLTNLRNRCHCGSQKAFLSCCGAPYQLH